MIHLLGGVCLAMGGEDFGKAPASLSHRTASWTVYTEMVPEGPTCFVAETQLRQKEWHCLSLPVSVCLYLSAKEFNDTGLALT